MDTCVGVIMGKEKRRREFSRMQAATGRRSVKMEPEVEVPGKYRDVYRMWRRSR